MTDSRAASVHAPPAVSTLVSAALKHIGSPGAPSDTELVAHVAGTIDLVLPGLRVGAEGLLDLLGVALASWERHAVAPVPTGWTRIFQSLSIGLEDALVTNLQRKKVSLMSPCLPLS